MQKTFLSVVMFILLVAGCSKQNETIFLDCKGKETTEGSYKNGLYRPETVNVIRTFKIYKARKATESGSQSFDEPHSNEIKVENKQVYVMSVDNGIDFFEKDVYTFQGGSSSREHGYVSVSETEIFAEQIKDSKTKYDDYRVTINRISGEFRETHLEKFEIGNHAVFTTTSEGACKKVDKMF